MRIKIFIVIFFALIVIAPRLCLAYEPLLVDFARSYQVNNPEVAKEIYSKLRGLDMTFRFTYEESGDLDITLLIPDVPDAGKNVTGVLSYLDEEGNKQRIDLSFSDDEWNYYKDDFTGNAYYLGPEAHVKVASGTHALLVKSLPDNEKPFIVRVGSIEDNSLDAKFMTMVEMAKVKNEVYSEFPLSAYYNIYGIVLLIPTVLIGVFVVYLIITTYLRIKRSDEAEEEGIEQEIDEDQE